MEQTFQALGGILLKAIPTVIILLILHFYLKIMLFLRIIPFAADRKAKEYEAKFREARAEVYRQQEETRKQWLQDQAGHIAAAHSRTRASIEEARTQVAAETESARQNLQEISEALADEIADRVLAWKVGSAA